MDNFDIFSVFVGVATSSLVLLTILLVLLLYRLNRIFTRIDYLTEDAFEDLKSVAKFFKELRDNAIVSGLSLLIEKFISKAEKQKKVRK